MLFEMPPAVVSGWLLPILLSLCCTLLPACFLEWMVRQPWAERYHIAYPSSQRWKDPSNKNCIPSRQLHRESIQELVTSAVVGGTLLYALQLEFLSYEQLLQPPPLFQWMVQFLAMFYLVDFLEYVVHYAYHTNEFLWKHVHSKHHREYAPTALAGSYAEALDTILGAPIPLLIATLLIQPHGTVFYAMFPFNFMILGPVHHSGMAIPWLEFVLGKGWLPFRASARLHDAHHRISGRTATNLGNVTWLWDVLFGTLASVPEPWNCEYDSANKNDGRASCTMDTTQQ